MLVQIITEIGTQPLVVDAAHVVIYQDNGTPIAAAGELGVSGGQPTQLLSMAGNADFDRVLQQLGVNTTVVVNRLKLPKADVAGAKLLVDPNRG